MNRPSKISRDRTAHLLEHVGDRRLSDLLGRAYEQGVKDAAETIVQPQSGEAGA